MGVSDGLVVGEGVKVGEVRGKTVGATVFVGGIVVSVAVGRTSLLESTNLLASNSAAACRVGTGSIVGITNSTPKQLLKERIVTNSKNARGSCFLLRRKKRRRFIFDGATPGMVMNPSASTHSGLFQSLAKHVELSGRDNGRQPTSESIQQITNLGTMLDSPWNFQETSLYTLYLFRRF